MRVLVAVLALINVGLAIAAPFVRNGDANHPIYWVISGIGLAIITLLLADLAMRILR